MSIKILGKTYLKSKLEKERDKLKDIDFDIAEKFENYLVLHQEDRYTEFLQEKQKKVRERLDEIVKQIGWV